MSVTIVYYVDDIAGYMEEQRKEYERQVDMLENRIKSYEARAASKGRSFTKLDIEKAKAQLAVYVSLLDQLEITRVRPSSEYPFTRRLEQPAS
jgi:hypothetical protein